MGAKTEIAWTDATFNPWHGCVRVSPGCVNCYAEAFAKRTGHAIWGVAAPRRFFGEKHWNEPRKWNAAAQKEGVRRRVFCASMADVFEDRDELDPWRTKLWTLIEETPWLDWQLLTKRPENIVDRLPLRWLVHGLMPRNVWLGTTAEDQEHYDARWHELAEAANAFDIAVTFISYEPALGPLELLCHGCGSNVAAHRAPDGGGCSGWFPSWVIVGGESGDKARPFMLEWAARIVSQCRRSPIACFVKQLGDAPGIEPVGLKDRPAVKARLELLGPKGGNFEIWPDELKVREFPESRP